MKVQSNSNEHRSQMQQAIRENVQRLIAQLERGESDAMKSYLSAMAKFHRYSFGNILMIAAARPDATRVAGFHTWLQFGRHVKKGAKGIAILAPLVGKRREEDAKDTTENERVVYGFRRVYVWDVSQTEGEELPSFKQVTGEVSYEFDRLKNFVAAQNIELVFDESIAPALGTSYGGRIALLPDLSAAESFATLAHEVAHELLHRSERRAQTTRTQRETEAEAVAFIVSSAIGLDASSSADYITLYNGDVELLTESLELIQQTASRILEAITDKQQEEAA